MRFKNRTIALLSFLLVISVFGVSRILTGEAQGAPTPTPFAPSPGPVVGGPTQTPYIIIVTATPPPTSMPPPSPSAQPTQALPTLRKDLMGIQIYAYSGEKDWWPMVDRAQFMGLKWIKTQVSWKEMEPQKGVFAQPFTVIRDNLIYAGRRGFKIMISVADAPDWARPAEARGQLDGPPANPQDYADFVGTLLDQWGTTYLNAIEIWNEPNLIREWTGEPRDGATYKKYFDAAYAAVRARSTSMVIITAGPAPAGDTPEGSVNDRTWLRQLYAAGLPKNDPNLAIGIHPYGWANAPDAHCCASPSQGWDDQRFFFFLDNIADYRQIMTENGHANGKLWATEFGWATFQGLRYKDHVNGPPAIPPADPSLGWMNRLTEAQQAQYIVRAFQLAQTGDLATFMGPMILWNMNFSSLEGYVKEKEPSLPEAGYSVLTSDWGNRPAYDLLQAVPKE
jgi:hypothetical protein